jgi:hypothetical protein
LGLPDDDPLLLPVSPLPLLVPVLPLAPLVPLLLVPLAPLFEPDAPLSGLAGAA